MIDVEVIRAEWLGQCGICEFGVPGPCRCPDGDPRTVIGDLCDEVERLRAEVDDLEPGAMLLRMERA